LLCISILQRFCGDFCNNIGTFQTSSDVCFPVAIGVTTDMPLQREIGRS
jgi:hypothetical protein